MHRVSLARNAMATRFEFVLVGDDPVRLRAAGEEALDEIDRIEGLLSLYRASSDIAQVNARAAFEPVRVSPEVFDLLTACRAFHEATGHSFDITIGPLVRCWGFMKGSGERPSDAAIGEARELVGMDKIQLDQPTNSVRFARPGMMLDLGAVGKGYGLDAAAAILRENSINNALLHGGTSTVCALGADPEAGPWKVAIELHGEANSEPELLSVAELHDESLSVSAIWGKFFKIGDETFGHVIDPRTAWPSRDALLGAIAVDSATVSDAISTGVLLGSGDDLARIKNRLPFARFLQVKRTSRRAEGLSWIKPPEAPAN